MKRKLILPTATILLGMFLSLSACVSVKEYQKSKINDYDMSLSSRKSQKTELNFQNYREASSGANGGKTGGGCGCN